MERERKRKRAKEREENKGRKESERKSGKKTREDLGGPCFFPALSLAFFFARAPLFERLEQATDDR